MKRSISSPAARWACPSFRDFQALAAEHGCTVAATATGTWLVRGPRLVVELDPEGWAPLFVVQGSRAIFIGRSAEDAIQAALHAPPRLLGARKRRSLRRLVELARTCYWCGAALDLGEATADHRVPRSRGGTDDAGNIVPACWPCNRFRRGAMPELVLAGGAA